MSLIQTRITGNNTVTSKGTTVSYEDYGEGNVPLIFIHGFPFSRAMWQPQLDFLKKTNRVIAYDIRGYGASTAGTTKPTIDLFADDLIDFMNVLNIHTCVVCGLSMGGYIVLNAVHRYPERFDAVILSDTQCIADTMEAKEKRFKSIAQIKEGGFNEFASAFVKAVFSKDSLEKKLEVVEEIRNIILSTSPEIIMATLQALAERPEMCATLSSITLPTRIICGREDVVTPIKQSEFLVAAIPNAQIQIIEGAGHLSNIEQPNVFNECLAEFLISLNIQANG